jgi:hypothetical protein
MPNSIFWPKQGDESTHEKRDSHQPVSLIKDLPRHDSTTALSPSGFQTRRRQIAAARAYKATLWERWR